MPPVTIGRREVIAALGGAAAAWPLAARAQQRRYLVGHLAIAAPTDTPPPPPANWNAFVQGLREAGYTGMSAQASDIVGKRLQILQEFVPRDKAVAVLLNPDTPFSASALQQLRIAAQAGNRRGPALPGLRKRTLSRVSTEGTCECPNTTAAWPVAAGSSVSSAI